MFKGKVTSISDDRATVTCDDGQVLTVAMADLEGAPKLGSEVAIFVATLGSEDAGRTKLAQGLLNELLKG